MVRRRCESSGGDKNYRWGRMMDEGMIYSATLAYKRDEDVRERVLLEGIKAAM